jgi:hypothetical protein
VDKKCEDVAATQVLRKERSSIKLTMATRKPKSSLPLFYAAGSSVFAKLSRFISIMSEK